jgi:hypothetical protein
MWRSSIIIICFKVIIKWDGNGALATSKRCLKRTRSDYNEAQITWQLSNSCWGTKTVFCPLQPEGVALLRTQLSAYSVRTSYVVSFYLFRYRLPPTHTHPHPPPHTLPRWCWRYKYNCTLVQRWTSFRTTNFSPLADFKYPRFFLYL